MQQRAESNGASFCLLYCPTGYENVEEGPESRVHLPRHNNPMCGTRHLKHGGADGVPEAGGVPEHCQSVEVNQ